MERYDNKGRRFKLNPDNQVAVEVNQMKAEIVNIHEKLKDPVFLGSLFHVAASERENTNRILKTLLVRLDSLDARVRSIEGGRKASVPEGPRPPIILPEIDFEIITYVKRRKRVYANEVRRKFKYKGTNAACTRLNKLYDQGLLEKKQVGRRVYYYAKEVDVQKV